MVDEQVRGNGQEIVLATVIAGGAAVAGMAAPQFIAYAGKHPAACPNAVTILAGLMEAFIERIADVLAREAVPGVGIVTPLADTFRREYSGNSHYHALQTRLEKRFSHGLSFLTSYVFSKTISDSRGGADAGGLARFSGPFRPCYA